ncbi:hypothetical protein DPEC_G00297350 [Dallia pectoralis]|uniref:Uncharacterized protein n=1 Tax=Dallia pectoralis TaxID=75939 RepID=A0ACC2FFM8_DALPE|nr:hypothetical protein DPEC_G00297350 [Dallia pectoralis]
MKIRCCLYLLFGLILAPLQGLDLTDSEEVKYVRQQAKGTVGGSITLGCGSTLPNIFIWGFTRPGTSSNVALAYDYGQGAKIQPQLSNSPGRLSLVPNTSSLLLKDLHPDAHGMYTCQALYDVPQGAPITFYYTQLEVVEKDEEDEE